MLIVVIGIVAAVILGILVIEMSGGLFNIVAAFGVLLLVCNMLASKRGVQS